MSLLGYNDRKGNIFILLFFTNKFNLLDLDYFPFKFVFFFYFSQREGYGFLRKFLTLFISGSSLIMILEPLSASLHFKGFIFSRPKTPSKID